MDDDPINIYIEQSDIIRNKKSEGRWELQFRRNKFQMKMKQKEEIEGMKEKKNRGRVYIGKCRRKGVQQIKKKYVRDENW